MVNVEQLKQEVEEIKNRFNELVERLHSAGLKSVIGFDDLEIYEGFNEDQLVQEDEDETKEKPEEDSLL